MKRIDVSDLIAVAVKYHNEGCDEFIETISKSLGFDRNKNFHSPFHQLEDDFITKERDATGKYTKISLVRKRRESTENAWKEMRVEFTTSLEWTGKVSMKFFIENELQKPIKDDTFQAAFLVLFMKELKEAFGVEELGSISD